MTLIASWNRPIYKGVSELTNAAGAFGSAPFEWIVNSNALGVIFLSREDNFNIAFLSRHAVRRLSDRSLLGVNAEDLMGRPGTDLAGIDALSLSSLQNPDNYPATVSTIVQGRHIELAISSVMSAEGDYLGVMLTIKDISDVAGRLAESSEFKAQIGELAAAGRTEADKTEEVANGLNHAVAKVKGNGAQMSKLITELTKLNNQTRMLSLNASIESARAGTAGQAFRVIAEEVGELALRTQAVADEVEGILNTIDIDSQDAYDCATSVLSSVELLIATQRAMDREVQLQA